MADPNPVTDDPIIVGYTVELREDAEDGLLPPAPDSRLKDPLKIEAEEFAERAAVTPWLGRPASIVAVDCLGGDVFVSSLRGSPGPSLQFWNWLAGKYEGKINLCFLPGMDIGRPVFYGFDPEVLLSLVASECITANAGNIPGGFWRDAMCYDPWFTAVGNNNWLRSRFTITKLLRQLGIQHAADYEPCRDAMTDAVIVAELTTRLGLLHYDDVAVLRDTISGATTPCEQSGAG